MKSWLTVVAARRIGQALLGAALALGLQLGYVSAACHADLVRAIAPFGWLSSSFSPVVLPLLPARSASLPMSQPGHVSNGC